jgi:hypothetical protein
VAGPHAVVSPALAEISAAALRICAVGACQPGRDASASRVRGSLHPVGQARAVSSPNPPEPRREVVMATPSAAQHLCAVASSSGCAGLRLHVCAMRPGGCGGVVLPQRLVSRLRP